MGLTGNIITGLGTIAGVNFETGEYGVPVTLGLGDGVYIVSHSLSQVADTEKNTFFAGKTASDLVKRSEKIEGAIVLEPRYGDMRLIVAALGLSATGFSPVNLGGGYYEHFIEPSPVHTRTPDYFEAEDTVPDKFRNRFTFLSGTADKAYQFDGCFATGLQMRFDFNTQRITVPVTGRFMSVDDSANPDIDDLTLTNSGLIKLMDAVVYIKLLEGVTLATSKTFNISDSGGSTSITIPAGKYSFKRLASFLSTKLNRDSTLDGRYKCLYDVALRRFIVESDETSSVLGTGTVNEFLGFTTASSSKTRHIADSIPGIYPAAYSSSDKVGVSSIDLEYIRNDTPEMTAFTYPHMDEPVRGVDGLRVIFTLPRYSGDFLIAEGSAGGEYEISIQFSNPDSNEEFEIIIPCANLTSVESAIQGPDVPQAVVAFESSRNRHYFNPKTVESYNSLSYLWRIAYKGLTSGDTVGTVGVYKDRLHVGGVNVSTPFVKRIDENTISSDLGGYGSEYGEPKSMVEHEGLMYISDDSGSVAVWDGSTMDLAYASVSNYFARMISWNRKLYGIEQSTGYLKSYDGTSWTLENTFGGSTAGYDICAYNGHIYCLIKKSSTTRLYKFIVGTGASEIHDFGADYTNAHLCVFDQKIWAVANTALLGYDGSNKYTYSTDESASWMFAYNGHLCFAPITDSYFFYYDFPNEEFGIFYGGSYTSTLQGRGAVHSGKIYIPTYDTITSFAGIPLVLLRYKNQITTNPLYSSIP